VELKTDLDSQLGFFDTFDNVGGAIRCVSPQNDL